MTTLNNIENVLNTVDDVTDKAGELAQKFFPAFSPAIAVVQVVENIAHTVIDALQPDSATMAAQSISAVDNLTPDIVHSRLNVLESDSSKASQKLTELSTIFERLAPFIKHLANEHGVTL